MTERREEIAGWIERADLDLQSAAILRERAGPAVVACFLCQQACEKLLNALLVRADIVPPRTHDLAALYDAVKATGTQVVADLDRLE
jgi:HEPN domain-containing protein